MTATIHPFPGTLVRIPPQPAPCNIVPIPIRERTDLGGYRAAMKYADVVLICKRALSAITLGSSPEAARIARQTLEHVRDLSDWPQARALAASYLRILSEDRR